MASYNEGASCSHASQEKKKTPKKHIVKLEEEFVESHEHVDDRPPTCTGWKSSAQSNFVVLVNACVSQKIFSLDNVDEDNEVFMLAASLTKKKYTTEKEIKDRAKKLHFMALNDTPANLRKDKKKNHPIDFSARLAERLEWEGERYERLGPRLAADPDSPDGSDAPESDEDADEDLDDAGMELPLDEEAVKYQTGAKADFGYFPSTGKGQCKKNEKLITITSRGHPGYAAFFNVWKGISDMGHKAQMFHLLSRRTPAAMVDLAKGIFFSAGEQQLPQLVVDKAVPAVYEMRKLSSYFGNCFTLKMTDGSRVAKELKAQSGTVFVLCTACKNKSKRMNVHYICGREADALLAGRQNIYTERNIQCKACKQDTAYTHFIPNSHILLLVPSDLRPGAIRDIFKAKTKTKRVIKLSNGLRYVCKGFTFLLPEKPAQGAEATQDNDNYKSISVLVKPDLNQEMVEIKDPQNLNGDLNDKMEGKVDLMFYVCTSKK